MRRSERSNPMSNVVWINSGRDFRRPPTVMGELAMALAMAASGGRSVPDASFECALERMFAETPARPDADFFAARVLERLDRGWTARGLVVRSVGGGGGGGGGRPG